MQYVLWYGITRHINRLCHWVGARLSINSHNPTVISINTRGPIDRWYYFRSIHNVCMSCMHRDTGRQYISFRFISFRFWIFQVWLLLVSHQSLFLSAENTTARYCADTVVVHSFALLVVSFVVRLLLPIQMWFYYYLFSVLLSSLCCHLTTQIQKMQTQNRRETERETEKKRTHFFCLPIASPYIQMDAALCVCLFLFSSSFAIMQIIFLCLKIDCVLAH